MKKLIVFVVFLQACSPPTRPVEWIEASPEEIHEVCGDNAAGCAVHNDQWCVIYTPPVNESNFTDSHKDVEERVAQIVTHEMMHCKYGEFHD